MINAAIVGLGRWGRNLVNSVQGASLRLRFVRGVVRNPDAARDFAAGHHIELSADFSAMLADPRVQAVVLATPHSLHVAQIVAAAAAGKAVFCEKPLALTRADAERAVEACRQARVVLAVGQDKRFWPSMRELKRVVAEGRLGEILHVEGHFSNEVSRRFHAGWRESPAESPAASMTATGIHGLDAFVNVVGPVRRVCAQSISHAPRPDPHDTVCVLLEFTNRVSGVLASIRPTPFYWRVHVFGPDASAEALGENELVLRRTGEQPQRLTFEPVNALRAGLEAFADAVEGRAPYPVPVTQMIDTIAALDAIIRSVESGTPVAVGGP
jgi:predicted dehydrogenase